MNTKKLYDLLLAYGEKRVQDFIDVESGNKEGLEQKAQELNEPLRTVAIANMIMMAHPWLTPAINNLDVCYDEAVVLMAAIDLMHEHMDFPEDEDSEDNDEWLFDIAGKGVSA